jgi:ubiquitin-like protein ATG12
MASPSDAPAATPLPPASAAPAPPLADVKISVRAVGSAPILRRTKFKAPARERWAFVLAFLRRQLGLHPGDALFAYVNAAFAPSPAQTLGDLSTAFHVDGELVVSYSLAAAYG